MLNFVTRHYETKMEMVPYKALVWFWIGLFAKPISNKEEVIHNNKEEPVYAR